MNKARKAQCKEAYTLVARAHAIVDRLYDKEQDCVANYPENFQYTEQFERSEEAAEHLSEAMSCLDDAMNHLNSAIS